MNNLSIEFPKNGRLSKELTVELKMSGEEVPLGFIIDIFKKNEETNELELYSTFSFWFDDFNEIDITDENQRKLVMEQQLLKKLQSIIVEAKPIFTLKEYLNQVSNETTLGTLVSKYCKWDIDKILEVVKEALVDSNYHELAVEVENLFNIHII
jgi:hypothetical protein